MKFSTTTLLTLLGASFAQAQQQACPTATRTVQPRECRKECPFSDCNFTTTIRNPCGCPASIPTATLIAPCQADCPYQGCGMEFRTSALACPPPPPPPTTRRTTPTPRPTTSVVVVTRITTLQPVPTTPCPSVTRTTSPAGCEPIRCPVPTCQVRTTLNIPCNCNPRTVLFVQGCSSTCPGGCLTRTETVSAQRC